MILMMIRTTNNKILEKKCIHGIKLPLTYVGPHLLDFLLEYEFHSDRKEKHLI